MSDSQITKLALATAMKDLMAQRPMTKINIGDIVDCCNMNRKSFYYHFKDKYDLVNWIYYTEFVENVIENPELPTWDLLDRICDYFYNNKNFYSNALQVSGQNSFSEYFNDIMQQIIMMRFEPMLPESENKEFFANFLSDSVCYAISKWLLSGAATPPKDFVKLIRTAMSEIKLVVEDKS